MSAVSSPEIAIESSELHVGQLAGAGRRCGKDSLGVSECLHRYVEGIPWPEVRLL